MRSVTIASAARVAVGSSLTVRESLARVRSPRASARLPDTPTVSWKKMVSNLASSATWVMWAYSLKSMSAVTTASGWRQPARWLPGTLKNPPRRSCLVIEGSRRHLDRRPVGRMDVLGDRHAKVLAEGPAFVLGAEDAAALQLGDHHGDPFLERLGVVGEQQVEAVAGAGFQPRLHV